MTKPYPTIEEVHDRIHSQGKYPSARAIVETACDLDRDRREAPAEVERIDWAANPTAKFAAKDENGEVFGYITEPLKVGTLWAPTSIGAMRIDATIPGPWQESLRARPENV